MALFPFLKRRDAAETPATPAEVVQRARTRARQRLIGAVVLLGVGIIGFPLLFETEPRPIPVDVKIEIPRKDAVAPLAVPAPAGEARTRDSGRVAGVAPPASPPAASAAASTAAPLAQAPVEPPAEAPAASSAPGRAAAAASTVPSSSSADADRARALLEQRPAAPATVPAPRVAAAPAAAPIAATPATPATARFVVQVGAFADAGAAQRTRERVEKLGMKTYTQVVETGDGPRTRVRVGPFASREEADRAAARLTTAGLTAAVLTL